MVIVPEEDWVNGIAKMETAASIKRMKQISYKINFNVQKLLIVELCCYPSLVG